jgi:hypothetical protein
MAGQIEDEVRKLLDIQVSGDGPDSPEPTPDAEAGAKTKDRQKAAA